MFKSSLESVMFQYPENVVRIMSSQIYGLKRTIAHHFKNRHVLAGHRQRVHDWIQEYRRVVKNSGYDIALRQVQGK